MSEKTLGKVLQRRAHYWDISYINFRYLAPKISISSVLYLISKVFSPTVSLELSASFLPFAVILAIYSHVQNFPLSFVALKMQNYAKQKKMEKNFSA